MMSSRGMGDINPSKMPGGKKKARRDNTDFTQYKEGGKSTRLEITQSPVCASGLCLKSKQQLPTALAQVSGRLEKPSW
jgi:hypothetical protein